MLELLYLLLAISPAYFQNDACGPDPCSSTVCEYGRIVLGGCSTCYCNASPCLEYVCGEKYECKVVTNSGGQFQPQCVRTQEKTVCPVNNCSMSNCLYGFKSGSDGCATCECYNPCENFVCQMDEVCKVANVVCPPQGCIDPPMPYCSKKPANHSMPGSEKAFDPQIVPQSESSGPNPVASEGTSSGYSAEYLSTTTTTFSTTTSDSANSSPVSNGGSVCRLPKEVGPCKAAMPMFFYNSVSSQCEVFLYGGCGGNGNLFSKIEFCMERCGAGLFGMSSSQGPAEVLGDPCPQEMLCSKGQVCLNRLDENGDLLYTECVSKQTYLESARSTEWVRGATGGGRTTEPYYLCQYFEEMNMCPFGCMVQYDSAIRSYVPMCIPDSTTRSIHMRTFSMAHDIVCRLPSSQGEPCEGERAPSERWYFDSIASTCRTFAFLCRNGNQNNFATEADCLRRCGSDPTCPPHSCDQQCASGYVRDAKGCHTCECVDLCLGIDCGQANICKIRNRPCPEGFPCTPFPESVCVPDCPLKYCAYGFKSDTKTCDCQDPCDLIGPCQNGKICRRLKYKNYVGVGYRAECQDYESAWLVQVSYKVTDANFINEFEKDPQTTIQSFVIGFVHYIRSLGFGYVKDRIDLLEVEVAPTLKRSLDKLIKAHLLFVANSGGEAENYSKIFVLFENIDGLNITQKKIDPNANQAILPWKINRQSVSDKSFLILIIALGVSIPILIAGIVVAVFCCCKIQKERQGFVHRNLIDSVISEKSDTNLQYDDKNSLGKAGNQYTIA